MSLAAAVLAVVILLFTFRGLVLLTLPLAAVAFLLGCWCAINATRASARSVAVVALVLGLLALLVSVAALAAEITVDGGYDFYERRQP